MQSLWLATAPESRYPPLSADGLEFDVAIVGGGLTGLSTAYLLKEVGRKVAVLESRCIGHGETGRTTAHLTALQDVGFRKIASKFGREAARRMAEQGMEAIAWVEHVARAEGIDCDFRRLPAYIFTEKLRDVPLLARERRVGREAGLSCTLLHEAPLPFKVEAALRFEDQARFHPLRFLEALAERVQGHGSAIFEHTHVVDIQEGAPCRIETERGTVLARNVVVATDSVTVNRYLMQTKIAPYRTYAMALDIDEPLDGLFYDTESPYHYVRTHPFVDGRHLLIVGGEDHRVGELEDTHQPHVRLERWTRARFPQAKEVRFRWSGQVEEPVDGLPFVGRNALSSKIYLATGFSGTGMVNGILSAMLIAELIRGHKHPLERILDATRIKPLASAVSFVRENVDYPKHLVTDRLPARLRSVDAVKRGEGEIVGQGGRKLAVYRDEDGRVHAFSPVCPHMGCHVHWNAEAKSWDCPCHGSRFSCEGRVIHGPAVRGLKAIDLEREERQPVPLGPEESGASI